MEGIEDAAIMITEALDRLTDEVARLTEATREVRDNLAIIQSDTKALARLRSLADSVESLANHMQF